MPAGEAIEVGKMKSSIFMASGSGVWDDRSMDSRSFAMPDGALVGCWFALNILHVSQELRTTSVTSNPAYRACSRSLRFRFIDIMRHVKFSIRSWLGN